MLNKKDVIDNECFGDFMPIIMDSIVDSERNGPLPLVAPKFSKWDDVFIYAPSFSFNDVRLTSNYSVGIEWNIDPGQWSYHTALNHFLFGSSLINTGAGNDTVVISLAPNSSSLLNFDLGSGSDVFKLGYLGPYATINSNIWSLSAGETKASAIVKAGDGNDIVITSEGDDNIRGDGGDDVIHSGGGNDSILGGSGNDTIYAGRGNDTVGSSVFLDTGNDAIFGGEGDDILFGSRGGDASMSGLEQIIKGEDGDDCIYSQTTLSYISNISGNSYLEILDGGPGNDIIRTSPNMQYPLWGAANTSVRVYAGEGDDVVYLHAINSIVELGVDSNGVQTVGGSVNIHLPVDGSPSASSPIWGAWRLIQDFSRDDVLHFIEPASCFGLLNLVVDVDNSIPDPVIGDGTINVEGNSSGFLVTFSGCNSIAPFSVASIIIDNQNHMDDFGFQNFVIG